MTIERGAVPARPASGNPPTVYDRCRRPGPSRRGGMLEVVEAFIFAVILAVATRDGITLGTPDYMSPEQATGRPGLDGRSDQFGLGCVMYHLLTGRIPFPGDSQVERLASRIKGRPAPLAGLRPGVPPGLVAVVERLMANRADDRYPTADEAAGALRSFCGEGWPLGCDGIARPLVPAASAT